MPTKSQIVVVAMALGAILLASALLPASTSAASQRPTRIGFPSWIAFDVMLHAQESGLFEKHGLEVELIRFDEASDVAQAVMSGRLDAGFFGMATMIANHDKTPLEVIFITNISDGADGIVARPGIESVADLKGRRIGCKFRAANRLILAEALEHHGLSLRDIQLVDVSNEAAERMIEQGTIDAAVLWEPYLTAVADRIGGSVVHRTSEIESVVLDMLVVRADHALASPETVAAFRAVWFELLEEIDRQPDSVFSTLSRKLNLPVEQLAANWNGITPGDRQVNSNLLGGAFERNLREVSRLLAEPVPTGISPAPLPMQPEADR